MRVLCDVHIARKVVRFFEGKSIEAVHVNDILDGYFTKDADLSRYADFHGYVIITKDADFKDSHFLKASPRKLIKVSLGNIPTNQLILLLDKHLTLLQEKFDTGNCYIEINPTSIVIIGG
jgi:predicted nuclease of predicted toxin-antitoxin system